jgi:hypothetical protein
MQRWGAQRSWEKSQEEELIGQSLICERPFIASIPFNRGINAVTHTDYEGVGVKPDVQVLAKEALLTDHILVLRVLARTPASRSEKRNCRS